MGISDKLKWKRTINRLRFLYEEYDFVKEISREGAIQFQGAYEEYCDRHDIDIQQLNDENADKIADAYPPPPNAVPSPPPEIKEGTMVLYTPRPPDTDSVYQMTQDELEIHEIFNKIFKKLAIIYHPDKLNKTLTGQEKNDMLNIFKEISRAFEERRYFILLDYAEKNNVSVRKNYKQQTRWMKQESLKVETKTAHEKKTYNYVLAEAESPEGKDEIIRQFLKQLFDLRL